MDHIVSVYPVLAREQGVKRHGTDYAQLHLNICKETGVKLDNENRYDPVHKLVENSSKDEVQVQTDSTISDNRSYIIIGESGKNAYMFVDVAIAGERNAIKK